MLKAKVRGIYSTALTRLLLENGFEIVQPSQTIKQRYGLQENLAIPDIEINDRYDLQGVRVLGTTDAVKAFQSILHSSFEDVLTRKWRVNVDGIYIGEVVSEDEEAIYVNIGNDITGKLSKFEIRDKSTKRISVQVERKRMGGKYPVLTTKLKIVGNYAILVQNSKIGVSLKIQDPNKRAELYVLGKELAPNNWGIVWREPAASQPKNILKNEIATLTEKVKILNEKATSSKTPMLLIKGLNFMDVEFPSNSKKKLDELRSSSAPTLSGHHFYKSCGNKISAALEMAEKLLEKGQDISMGEELFKEQILHEFPEAGSSVNIEHVKLSGLILHLGQATVESLDAEHINYIRTMRNCGFYDGLGVAKEVGDKAISEAEMSKWFITTRYFSRDGKLKGTYINLNTPVEVYPNAVRYVDLEVDICIQPDGTVKVLDMEKLEKALKNQVISQRLFAKVIGTLQEILEE
ncbi:MAG: DUF402 domain-containing protein [Candidatus Bathyarchaeia archaeon]